MRDDEGRFHGAALAYKNVTDYQQSLRVKNQFVATVSHEFRTPLTAINGYVAMMLDDDLPAEVASHLAVVQRNTDRLHRLVSDLLLSASADTTPVAITRSVTDLAELVRTAVRSAEPAARRARVRIVADVPACLVTMADPQRFAQVVDNLLSNAVKYTLAGGEVRVGLCGSGDHVELTVADDGIGIGAEDQGRLFSRFFRARAAEEQSIQGVGLGLSIVRQIVQAHGGEVTVTSAPGAGSTFTVRLPAETWMDTRLRPPDRTRS